MSIIGGIAGALALATAIFKGLPYLWKFLNLFRKTPEQKIEDAAKQTQADMDNLKNTGRPPQ